MADDEGERRKAPRFSLASLRTPPTLPRLPTPVATAVTGLVCGLVATLLVWGGERGCDAVRGRPSCGGYGLLMLVGIIVVCFLIGVMLLKAFGVNDPGVITFFGVTLPLLAILGLLLDYVFDTWMAFTLPVLVAVCFVASAYLARALDAANPSPYTDDAVIRDDDRVEAAGDPDAVEADDADETRVDQHATRAEDDTAVQRHDDLPRYAPSDDA